MIRAKKSLGQNFLIDQNILTKITNSVTIENKEIFEVGPGTGNLTEFIVAQKPKKIFLIEKDETLANDLEKRYLDNISIIKKDILKKEFN